MSLNPFPSRRIGGRGKNRRGGFRAKLPGGVGAPPGNHHAHEGTDMSAANEIIYAKMAYSPNLGRRKSIAALGAVLAGAALGAAAGSPADAGPDDALIAACAEFEALAGC